MSAHAIDSHQGSNPCKSAMKQHAEIDERTLRKVYRYLVEEHGSKDANLEMQVRFGHFDWRAMVAGVIV